MPQRTEQVEAITGIDRARKYAEEEKRYTRLMFGPLLKDVKKLKLSGKCLEVGAGPGLLAIAVAQDNPDVRITAVDISQDMISVADEYIQANGFQDRIHCRLVDAADREGLAQLGKFDLVYSTFSLHHWKDPVKSISNLWYSVKDGGVLYIYDFRRVAWLKLLPFGDGDIASIKASYTKSEVDIFMQQAGITDYHIKLVFPFFIQSAVARK